MSERTDSERKEIDEQADKYGYSNFARKVAKLPDEELESKRLTPDKIRSLEEGEEIRLVRIEHSETPALRMCVTDSAVDGYLHLEESDPVEWTAAAIVDPATRKAQLWLTPTVKGPDVVERVTLKRIDTAQKEASK